MPPSYLRMASVFCFKKYEAFKFGNRLHWVNSQHVADATSADLPLNKNYAQLHNDYSMLLEASLHCISYTCQMSKAWQLKQQI